MSGVKCGMAYSAADAAVITVAETAERLGFDSFWVGEHVACFAPSLSVIPALGALAGRTSRLEIGCSVIVLPLRNPVIVAKELAIVDMLSRGRLVVGVGVGGENPAEFAACEIPVKQRGGRANEALQIIKGLWGEPEISFHGKYYNIDNVSIAPRPVQPGGPPILVSGRSEAAMRRAAIYGDGYLPYLFTPNQFAKAMGQISGLADQAGRDLRGFSKYLMMFTRVAKSKEEARRTIVEFLNWTYSMDFGPVADKFCLIGTPDDCLERMEEYRRAGVEHFILTPCSRDGHDIQEQLNVIAERIISTLRTGSGVTS